MPELQYTCWLEEVLGLGPCLVHLGLRVVRSPSWNRQTTPDLGCHHPGCSSGSMDAGPLEGKLCPGLDRAAGLDPSLEPRLC